MTDGQPLVPGPARRAFAKSMPHQTLPPLIARQEFRWVHKSSRYPNEVGICDAVKVKSQTAPLFPTFIC